MNDYNKRSLPKTEEQNQALKLTVIKLKLWNHITKTKETALQEDRSLQVRGSVAVDSVDIDVGMRLKTETTLARDRGRRRLFDHIRNQGEQVETLWESGKTIRHLTQEEGQDT